MRMNVFLCVCIWGIWFFCVCFVVCVYIYVCASYPINVDMGVNETGLPMAGGRE